LELQNTHSGENNRLVWGLAFRADYANSPLLIGEPRTVQSRRLFAHDEYRFNPAWIVNVGSMAESDTNGLSTNSPRASINYHFTPQQTLRVGMSTASRMPQMGETDMNSKILGMGFVPPVNKLKPEQIFSREIAYLGEFPDANITLDARLYVDQVRDLIWVDRYAAYPNGVQDSLKNLLSADYRGFESTVKYRWNDGLSLLVVNYAYQQATATLTGDPTQIVNMTADPFGIYPTISNMIQQLYQTQAITPYAEIVPKHSLSLLVSQALTDSIQLSGGYYYRSLVRVSNVSPDMLPEFVMRRFDLRLAKTFGNPDRSGGGEVALVLQNATQDDYNMYSTVPQRALLTFSRRAYLTASINY